MNSEVIATDVMNTVVQKTITTKSSVEEVLEFIEVAVSGSGQTTRLLKLREGSTQYLLSKGFPDPARIVVFENTGLWRYLDDGERPVQQRMQLGWAYALDRADALSVEWYMAKIYRACTIVDAATKNGDFERLGDWMLELGVLIERVGQRARSLKQLTSRKKQLDGLHQNTERRNVENRRRAKEAAALRENARDLARKATSAGMARARWVKVQLKKIYGEDRSEKTIQKWIRDL